MLLGSTKQELGASQYLEVIHGLKKGMPPVLNLKSEKRLYGAITEFIKKGLINSAHDCSEGGLAVALAECSISSDKKLLGAAVNLNSKIRPDALLFGESQSRVIISCGKNSVEKIKSIAGKNNVPIQAIGKVGGDRLKISGAQGLLINTGLKKLFRAWRERLVG